MPTIKDIADKAGISIGTVDRILHNRGRFSVKTAEKVHRIVKELGYTPNAMARQLSRSKRCRIAVLIPNPRQDSRYWESALTGIQRAEAELAPFGLRLQVYHFDRYLPGDLARLNEEIDAEEIDGLLLAPLRSDEAHTIVDNLPESLEIVYFDTDLPKTRRLCYVGQDSLQAGRLGARLMNLINPTSGPVLVVSPDSDNEHLSSRIRGFSESLGRATRLLRVTVESDQNLDLFCRQMDRELNQGVTGIFVVDASAHFVASYLSRQVPEQFRPPVIGFDLVPDNREWMDAGGIDFLLGQHPADQGFTGIHRLFRKIVVGEQGPGHIYTPIDIIIKENLAYLAEVETS